MAVRALIAEDSRSIRNAIRLHLECVGCDVVAEVGTAAQALQLVRTVRPDVVALDPSIPGFDGTDQVSLFHEIRKAAPQTRILVLSGNADPIQDEAVFLREGALGYIPGPFGSASFDRLWRALSSVYPELRDHGFAARLSQPLAGQPSGQNRQTA